MSEETVPYRGHAIQIEQDEFAANPFEDWDCNPPIVVGYDGHLTSYGEIDRYPPDLTRKEIIDNLGDVLSLLGYDDKFAMARALWDSYQWAGYDLAYVINHTIFDKFRYNDTSTSDQTATIAAVYGMKGIVALDGSTSGYSQGDYADVLVIATPEWLKTTGAKIDKPEDLQGTVDLYGAWAWGDVYGFNVDSIDDSCWGFYGDDHEKSGLLDAARSSVDCYIEHERKEHARKLKAQIRNHVPFYARHRLVEIM